MRLDRNHAQTLLDNIRGTKVAVFGDMILDEYLFGEVNRISPEAPVPVVRVVRERAVLGGAANVAANLKAIGAEAFLVGTLQNDPAGQRLQHLLLEQDISTDRLVMDASRPTIIKTRIIGQQQQMLRIDREETGEQKPRITSRLKEVLAEVLQDVSALVVSDYAKGAVSKAVMDAVRTLCVEKRIPWIVDPKPAHRDLYTGATLMTPNARELTEFTSLPVGTDKETSKAGRKLMVELGLTSLLVTRSEKGMAFFPPASEHREEPWLIPTEAREVFDVSGAGDTVIAVFSAAVASGADWKDAAMLANAAAGVVVAKMGTATVTPEELMAHYQDQEAL